MTAEYFAHIEVLADLLLRLPSNSDDQHLMKSVLMAQQEYVYFWYDARHRAAEYFVSCSNGNSSPKMLMTQKALWPVQSLPGS